MPRHATPRLMTASSSSRSIGHNSSKVRAHTKHKLKFESEEEQLGGRRIEDIAMAAPSVVAAPNTVQYEMLGVKVYENGMVDRSEHDPLHPTLPADADRATEGAFSRDVVIDSTTRTWVRLYIPACTLSSSSASSSSPLHELPKLPIILYFHGGGFVLWSAATATVHEYCCKVAATIGTIVISVDYRLAPEHKLPAAFEDGLSALTWLQGQCSSCSDGGLKDPWLSAHGDFTKCMVMGHSAGVTIAHQIMSTPAAVDGFHPLKIRGLILAVPFFGGMERTRSEIEYGETDTLTLKLTDAFWAVSLPQEANRDHPYCTFLSSSSSSSSLESESRIELPPCLVVIGAGDPLHDRQIQYVDFLRKAGTQVTLLEYREYGHQILYPEVTRQEDVEDAYLSMQRFVTDSCVHESLL